jgi:hypothetical protein
MTNSLSARSVDCVDDDNDDEKYLHEVFDDIFTFNISVFISEPLIYFAFHDNTLIVPHIILSAFTE